MQRLPATLTMRAPRRRRAARRISGRMCRLAPRRRRRSEESSEAPSASRRHAEPLVAELRSFVDAVSGQGEAGVTGLQGAEALEVALEITRLIQRDSGKDGLAPGLLSAAAEEGA